MQLFTTVSDLTLTTGNMDKKRKSPGCDEEYQQFRPAKSYT